MSNSVSPLQKDKFLHTFDLLDIDGNGVLQYDDFRIVVDTMCDERGWSEGHRRRRGLVRANRRLWDMMTRYLDADGDGDISLIEWLSFHFQAFSQDPSLARNNPELNGALNSTAQFFCDMLDSDGDGRVIAQDYVLFCEAYNIEESEAKSSFQLFDKNHDGILQISEVDKLIREFYLSSDPDSPGNVFFGVF
jgi:Ca2+-binding EF-hand superfamily protein